MYILVGWQRWLVIIISLPVVAIISTFIVSQTQISQLAPTDMPHQQVVWTALQLSVASGLLWLLWPDQPRVRQWTIIASALVEGLGLFGVALGIGWYLGLIDISWQFTSERIIAMLALAIPLAWWSMAEERILRNEVGHMLNGTPTLIRDLVMLGVAWLVQTSMITTTSVYVLIVVVLTEGLSIITWSGSADFERAWARRWTWRWVLVAGAGLSSTGFVTSTPTPLVITTDDPFALIILVAATLAAWVSYSGLQRHASS